ncbi:MAG: ribose-phosphate pyrophosphokinase [Anaerolineae bacterium]|nr:ribose-phosphate pyrophosphokinase [Anaerolineae bacterium]
MYGNIKLIAGTSCPDLAQEISDYLTETCEIHIPLADRSILKFPNDNTYVRLNESVRGQDVYIIQTITRPVNDIFMELLITLDAVRRDSAGRITAVIPHMAYDRSDRKDQPRTPITARLVADLLQVAGADRYITIDLHAAQIQGFFSIPGDALTAYTYILKDYIAGLQIPDLMVVTVDLGFAKGGRDWARELDVPLAFVEKMRKDATSQTLSLIGDVRGRSVLLVDDEVDTAGSMVNAVELLDREGAKDILIAFTHPVFSPPALERLAELQDRVSQIVFTNTIPVPQGDLLPNMKVISVASMLGEVIYRAHVGKSVGKIFNE